MWEDSRKEQLSIETFCLLLPTATFKQGTRHLQITGSQTYLIKFLCFFLFNGSSFACYEMYWSWKSWLCFGNQLKVHLFLHQMHTKRLLFTVRNPKFQCSNFGFGENHCLVWCFIAFYFDCGKYKKRQFYFVQLLKNSELVKMVSNRLEISNICIMTIDTTWHSQEIKSQGIFTPVLWMQCDPTVNSTVRGGLYVDIWPNAFSTQ